MYVERETVVLARGIAYGAHAGQLDKAGHKYISHPARVARDVGSFLHASWNGVGSIEHEAGQVVAWLHDVLEDTFVTSRDLLIAGIPHELIYDVDLLTHQSGEPRDHYYARILTSRVAVAVKLADVKDNSDPERLSYLPQADQDRLTKKYDRAREVLTRGSL